MHPYKFLPAHCFWRGSIAGVAPEAVDPVVRAKFQIGRSDKVVTAGSCFAQHIARYLQQSGFCYFVTETAHPLVRHLAGDYNYGVFSARYGNLYTSRQLWQLLQRAYGLFAPEEDCWRRADGRLIDPFRPQIQPNGFASLAEFRADRAQHLAAVRRAVEELDVFVFTLGLTEVWLAKRDGAAFPLCPGVAGGEFDPDKYEFRNLGLAEVVGDMEQSLSFLRAKNPRARVVLTVSPVPLAATAEDRSVLVSTTLSKSVLRVAADLLSADQPEVAYFPSYEIITGHYTGGRYFANDLRNVTEAGVAHVMRLFMKHYASDGAADAAADAEPAADAFAEHQRRMERAAQVVCEEEMLDRR